MDIWASVLFALLGSAGVAGVIGAIGQLRGKSRLERRLTFESKLVEDSLTSGDNASVALRLALENDRARYSARQLLRTPTGLTLGWTWVFALLLVVGCTVGAAPLVRFAVAGDDPMAGYWPFSLLVPADWDRFLVAAAIAYLICCVSAGCLLIAIERTVWVPRERLKALIVLGAVQTRFDVPPRRALSGLSSDFREYCLATWPSMFVAGGSGPNSTVIDDLLPHSDREPSARRLIFLVKADAATSELTKHSLFRRAFRGRVHDRK